jgi:uncharacterized protein (DUF1778 family)
MLFLAAGLMLASAGAFMWRAVYAEADWVLDERVVLEVEGMMV